jgi:hypothetical protein
MAYKFQLGKAKLSGSIEVAQKLTVDAGGLQVAGDVALDAGVINTSELADSLITVGKLATDAVETAKIKDLAVTNDKLAGSIASSKIAELNAFDTADLAEGTNLYYTDARARASVSVTDVSGDGSLSYNSSTGVITYTGPSASEVRAHLSAGNGLSYAGGQFAVTSSIAGAGLAWDAGVLSVDTAEIAAGLSGSIRAAVADFVEGSDFVTFDDSTGTIGVSAAAFTGSARSVVSVTDAGGDGSLSYNASTGVISYTGPSAAEARAHFSAVDAGGDGSFSYAAGVFTYTGPSSAETRAHFSAGNGLAFNSGSGLFGIAPSAAGNGLSIASGSFAVNVDASTIEIDTDTLRLKDLGITNAKIADATIANGKLVNSSVSVVAGGALTGGGTVALGSSITLDVAVNGDALEVTGDQVALKSSISGNRTFANNVVISGDLTVNGTTTYLNTTNLDIADALVKIASGSAAFAANQGIELGGYASLKTAVDATVGNALSSSLPLIAPSVKASSFYGNLVGSMQLSVETKSLNATISKNVTRATANITLTLPTSPVVGQEHRVKCFVADASSPAVVVAAQAGATIEGESQVVLQSFGAALSLVWDGSAWMVF